MLSLHACVADAGHYAHSYVLLLCLDAPSDGMELECMVRSKALKSEAYVQPSA